MRIVVFGATGMIGGGVLHECLADPRVAAVLAILRRSVPIAHPKLEVAVVGDVGDLSTIESRLGGLDAAFFCLGVSSVGMEEGAYRRVTHDLTISVARTLLRLNPRMTFAYVSGAGTDSTESGRVMWARVKGQTENELLRMGFGGAYMFRPGFIRATSGARLPSAGFAALYYLVLPFLRLASLVAPSVMTSTDRMARAMVRVALHGAPTTLLSNREINALAKQVEVP